MDNKTQTLAHMLISNELVTPRYASYEYHIMNEMLQLVLGMAWLNENAKQKPLRIIVVVGGLARIVAHTHTVNTHYHTHVSQKNWRARLGMPNRRTPMETNDCDCMSVWLRLCACVCIFYSRRPSGADNNNNNNEAYNINSRDDDDGPRSFVSLFNIHSIPYTYE